MKLFIVSSTIPAGPATYIFQTQKERDIMLDLLRNEYPLFTFYIGVTDQHSGAVYWDRPPLN